MSAYRMRHRQRKLVVEALEDRAVPATFGVPWLDASNLTLSFAPDGTAIAGHTSTLFRTLNAQAPTAAWQHQVLQAFQTWAVQANINIGLVSDGGQAFGVTGKSQRDPRFGDIRVGGQAMSPEVLSISVPNDPALSSTWTGDVLVNSNDVFGTAHLNLFSVMLHEAGHVFGLSDSSDPKSPLYGSYNSNVQLTAADISALRAIYGTRSPDLHEGSSGNDSINKATQIQPAGSSTGAVPLVAFGDISTTKDLDFYAVKPPSNYNGPVIFRLQSAGISLLAPHITVFDSQGRVIGDVKASSGRGDVLTVHLASSDPSATYYIEVQGATHDVFGIGSYALGVTFDAATTVSSTTLDSVMRGPYQTLSPNDFFVLFANPGQALFNSDQASNDDVGSATTLAAVPGYAHNTFYETIASISSPTDVDFYRIQTADTPAKGKALVLTATVRAMDVNGAAPRVAIFDSDGNLVGSQILANGNGTFTVQATNVKGGGHYLLKVFPGRSDTSVVGNYSLTAEFGTSAAQLTTFAAGSLAPTAAQGTANFYVGESQLFQFLLSATAPGAPAGTSVQLSIIDQAGNTVYSLTAAAGDTTSGDTLLLKPGAYTLRVVAVGPGGTAPKTPLAFNLSGESISDPIGPATADPTLAPVYSSSTMPGLFTYPSTVPMISPFYITGLVYGQPTRK